MARRRGADPQFTLFPFLSVLAVVMGTLILIISGMSQLALANPKQRIEVERFDPGKKTPIYVECVRTGLLVYPDDPTSGKPTFVPYFDIGRPSSVWGTLVRRVELHNATHYVLMLVRAEGVSSFRRARDSLDLTTIELGYQPLFLDGAVRFEKRAR